MADATSMSDLQLQAAPVAVLPGARAALHDAITCIDTAGRAMRPGRGERADEVLALLQAAASHLETAWDIASRPDEAPPHMRGAE